MKPMPSWEDFCERVKTQWPQLTPIRGDEQWENLYGVYQMGYGACLEHMKTLLNEEATK